MISIIVAASSNLAIGKDNKLLWHLPTDLKNFKRLTDGKYVIMGRMTWESLPDNYRPLPNRKNIVISNKYGFEAVGATIVNDLDILLSGLKNDNEQNEVFVIGGGKIYKDTFKYADKVYMTQVWGDIDGDTFLEGFDREQWVISHLSNPMEENGFKFIFVEYTKKL